MFDRVKEYLFGRPLTRIDILEHRLTLLRSANLKPEQVENFWAGIEMLKEDSHALRVVEARLRKSNPGPVPAAR